MRIENIFKLMMAGTGGVCSFLWGGWSELLSVLCGLMVFDYLTGFLVAIFGRSPKSESGKISSGTGLIGITKKILVLFIVAIANLVDKYILKTSLLYDVTIFFYIANELVSIVENLGLLGVKLLSKFYEIIEILSKKGDE